MLLQDALQYVFNLYRIGFYSGSLGVNEALETETVDLLTNKTVISNSYFISDHRVIPKVSVFNSTTPFKVSMAPLKENLASTFSVMFPPAAT